ncbi:MAG: glycosyl transferase, partial [Rhizobiaceae bacterium]
VADILRAGCGSVLYPYTGGRETEQLRRAEIMESLGLAVHIESGRLSPQTLAKAVDLVDQKTIKNAEIAMNGAQETASILEREYEEIRNLTC